MVWIHVATTLASSLPPPFVEADTQMNAVDRQDDRENLFAILSFSDLEALQEKLQRVDISENDLQLVQSGDARDVNWQDHDYEYWALRILKAADTKQMTAYAASKMLLFLQALEDYTDEEEVRVFQLVKDDGTIDYDVFCELNGQNLQNSFYRAVFDWNWYKKLIEAPSNTKRVSILHEHQKLKDQLFQLVEKKGVCATQVFSVVLKDSPAVSRALVIPPELLAMLLFVRYGEDAVLPAPVIGGLSPAWRFASETHRDMAIPLPESLDLPCPWMVHGMLWLRQSEVYSSHDTEHLTLEGALTREERSKWISLANRCTENKQMRDYILDRSFEYNFQRSHYRSDIDKDANDALIKGFSYGQFKSYRRGFELERLVVAIMSIPSFDLEKFTNAASNLDASLNAEVKNWIMNSILPLMQKQRSFNVCESGCRRV